MPHRKAWTISTQTMYSPVKWGDRTVDQIGYWRRKSRRSAEVLVPDLVTATHVRGAYVSCEDSRARCPQEELPIALTVDADLFFQA